MDDCAANAMARWRDVVGVLLKDKCLHSKPCVCGEVKLSMRRQGPALIHVRGTGTAELQNHTASVAETFPAPRNFSRAALHQPRPAPSNLHC